MNRLLSIFGESNSQSRGSQDAPGPASPRNLLGMQILRWLSQKLWGCNPSGLCFHSPPRWCWYTIWLENHYPRRSYEWPGLVTFPTLCWGTGLTMGWIFWTTWSGDWGVREWQRSPKQKKKEGILGQTETPTGLSLSIYGSFPLGTPSLSLPEPQKDGWKMATILPSSTSCLTVLLRPVTRCVLRWWKFFTAVSGRSWNNSEDGGQKPRLLICLFSCAR